MTTSFTHEPPNLEETEKIIAIPNSLNEESPHIVPDESDLTDEDTAFATMPGASMEMSSLTISYAVAEGIDILECISTSWAGGSFNLPDPPQGQIGVGFDEGPPYDRYISSFATWSCPECVIEKIDKVWSSTVHNTHQTLFAQKISPSCSSDG